MQDLGTLGGSESGAYSVSADGSVVVGWAQTVAGQAHAFRWTASEGMQDLGRLPYNEGAWAFGVSGDGSVVVGNSTFSSFLWTESRGMEDLNRVYASLLGNSRLHMALAISPNGRYIVGVGYNAARGRREAYLLDTGFPIHGDVDRNGCVDDADLLRLLFEFGGNGYRNEDLNWDGTVDDADLLEVLFNFGSGC